MPSTSTREEIPVPGTQEAILDGCTCPVTDNCCGLGICCNAKEFGYWIARECPIHKREDYEPKRRIPED